MGPYIYIQVVPSGFCMGPYIQVSLNPIYLKQNHSHFRTWYRPARSTGFGNDSWQSEGRQPAILSKPKNAATKSRQRICRIDTSGQEKKMYII